MHLVVVGASGFVGRQLVPLLLETGHVLHLVGRDEKSLREMFPNCEVSSPWGWSSKAEGFDALLYLSAINSDSSASRAEFLNVNADLAEHCAAEARRVGISRFIYASSTHALDHNDDRAYPVSKRIGAYRASAAFGSGAITVFWGAVHGKSFSGKLQELNRLPEHLSRFLFRLLSAYRPTTSTSLIVNFLDNLPKQDALVNLILTDSKDIDNIYRLWVLLLNCLFVLATALFLPVLLGFAALVVLVDGRPGFHQQTRVGKNRKVFQLFKIRTMSRESPLQASHQISENQVLRIGRVLRRLRIDEFPQAWNIMKGEMNLIGPRPSLPTQYDLVDLREELGVLNLKPGITGWAQVHGIDMEFPEKVTGLDAEYLGIRSVWLDVRILLRTLRLA